MWPSGNPEMSSQAGSRWWHSPFPRPRLPERGCTEEKRDRPVSAVLRRQGPSRWYGQPWILMRVFPACALPALPATRFAPHQTPLAPVPDWLRSAWPADEQAVFGEGPLQTGQARSRRGLPSPDASGILAGLRPSPCPSGCSGPSCGTGGTRLVCLGVRWFAVQERNVALNCHDLLLTRVASSSQLLPGRADSRAA